MAAPLVRFGSLDQFDFHHTLAGAAGVSIVFFTKPGCGSCGSWRELLRSYAKKNLESRIFEVDASKDQGLAQEFELFHLPSLHVFRDGNYYGEIQCEASYDHLANAISRAVKSPVREMP